ncbi:hypothetical protein WOLCODRAFT_136811 [Wolfiporia cocos MD-104 SS10]|uniref:Uncharacterized protein n=1 Tax=Wolfiporia cocos (strain MD-104) TaxID=742152 RepID=A0A2H3JDR2_WOLCO|nr:hypothetical protein WOLCODRAFT_136811 [Wolfiporia cocos MD-104 SS10]
MCASTPLAIRTNHSRNETSRDAHFQYKLQSAQSPLRAYKPSLPIAIPRRKTARPPPCSPLRHQSPPELVFNLDFSVSPCSFHGSGEILSQKDEWIPAFLQQRGRANLLLAHQCYQQKARYMDVARQTRSPSVKCKERPPLAYAAPWDVKPAVQAGQECAFSDRTAGEHEQENVSAGVHSRHASPSSSEASFAVFTTPSGDALEPEPLDYACKHGNDAGPDENTDLRLTSAFQRSIASSVVSQSALSSSLRSRSESPYSFSDRPASPAVRHPFTPVSQSPPAPRVFQVYPARRPLPLPTAFPTGPTAMKGRAHLLRSAAAPVVSLKVAQAERVETPPRGRSPAPRGCRSPSGVRGPTVVGFGRVCGRGIARVPSIVLSNEELERSLEHGQEKIEEPVEKERGRPRGRTRARGIAVVRAAPGHM